MGCVQNIVLILAQVFQKLFQNFLCHKISANRNGIISLWVGVLLYCVMVIPTQTMVALLSKV